MNLHSIEPSWRLVDKAFEVSVRAETAARYYAWVRNQERVLDTLSGDGYGDYEERLRAVGVIA